MPCRGQRVACSGVACSGVTCTCAGFGGIPAQGDGAGVGVTPGQGQHLLPPDAKIGGADLASGQGACGKVQILGKGTDVCDSGLTVLAQVNGFG
ncbi:MAG TPA: hypothetical protein DDW70_00890 [Rikenellaceae bacterium]|nr:hypothetical protein [Rikenellaceae bacterium]